MSLLDYLINNRPLQLHADLPPGMLLASELKGCEEISKLYQFELGLLTPRPLSMDFTSILGKEAAIELRPSSTVTRYFHGLINRFTESRKDEHFTHYSASLVPKLWLWTQQIRNRVFQHMTVPEILTAVFTGLDVNSKLTAPYQPREYCVQYQESDFDFASRLMEEEGIYYFFEHRIDGHTLVLTDSHFQLTDVPQPSVIRFDELEGGVLEELRVHRWNKSQQIRTSSYTLWDYTFQMPDDHLEAQQQIQEQIPVGTVTHKLKAVDQPLERYEYPGGYARHFDGVTSSGGDESGDLAKIFEENQRIVRVRMQEEAAGAIWIDGQSNCAQFLPGHHFNLMWHGTGDGQYLLRRVEHSAELDLSYRSDDTSSEMKYANRFVCLPGELPFRAARVTARPRIEGMQTATVVGPGGDQVFIDKYGRVKIQFHWDRQGQLNASSSCWVRVAQIWAGNRWGAFFWPRLGQEVVVTFEEGNPDRPLIIGSAYNADNMPPFELPTNLNLCGIRSCTLAGNGTQTFNTIVFDDTANDEHLQLHSENHVHVSSELANYNYVPQNQIHMIGSLPFGSGSGGGPRNKPSNNKKQYLPKPTPFSQGSGMGGGRARRKRNKTNSWNAFSPNPGSTTCGPGIGLSAEHEALVAEILGPELVQQVAQIRNRPRRQSGQGGGLWDFPAAVAAGGGGSEEFREFFETQMPCSFTMTSGDSTAVYLRDNISRYWSTYGVIVADIEEILFGSLLGHFEAPPIAEGLFGALMGAGGLLTVGAGGASILNYGPNFAVQRGESLTVNQSAFGSISVAGLTVPQAASAQTISTAVRVMLVVIILGSLICDILLRIKCVPTASTGKVDAPEYLLFTFNAVYSRLLAILGALEKAFADIQKALDAAAAAAKNDAQATFTLTRSDPSATAIATGLVTAAETRLRASITALQAATAAAARNLTATTAIANEAANHDRQIAGNYGLAAAGDINIRSSVAAGASSIFIRAEGAGGTPATPGTTGSLNLIGTETVNVSCGGAGGIRVAGTPAAVDEIAIDGGLAGEAKMFTGVPEEGPRIILDPIGLSIQNGVTAVGSAITLQIEELTISCGVPGVGAAIKLTPESLSLSVGENIWNLTPEGLTKQVMMEQAEVDVSAEVQAAVYNLILDAMYNTEAALNEQV